MVEQYEVNEWQDIFTAIIEDADANILLLDEQFGVIGLNPGFYWIFFETYGIELKPGVMLLEALSDVNQSLTAEWKERCVVAMSGTPVKVEDVFEIDGKNYYWEIHFRSTVRPDGSRLISVFSRDITIRRAFQQRVVENEANLRSIFNTIDDCIWLVNASFELIDFNREFYNKYQQAFGVKLVKGANVLSLIPDHDPEYLTRWQQRYESGLTGRPGKFYDTYRVGEETRTYEIKTYPIREDGEVTGLTVYARDITHQTRTGDLLKKQNEELIRINEELDRFVYSASHDLRAPLMSVKGLLHMINLDPEQSNTAHYLHLMDKSINKLDNFISDIIDHSRNTRMEIKPKEISFHELLQESIDSLKYMEGAEDVRTIKHIDLDTPFYSDYSRLLIVFNNIIANAVRYRSRWKADSFLKIEISEKDTSVTIRFTDNGDGIAEEYIDKIFKMFFRASADSNGSGLGLYIVRGVVEKLGGTIAVASTLGSGTTFTVELPNLVH